MLQSAWDFIWNNFLVIWGILGTLGTAYGFLVHRRDKSLEEMPEFEFKSIGYSTNGRKVRLINKSKIMVKVVKLDTKIPELIDFDASTALNWYLNDNENNFYIQLRSRVGDIKIRIIFENRLHKQYVQILELVKRQDGQGDKVTITNAKPKFFKS